MDSYRFIENADSLGYEGVEIPSFDGNIDHKLVNQRLSSASNKIEVIVVGGGSPNADVSSADKATRVSGEKYIRKLIEKAVALNSNLVCGPLYSSVGRAQFLTREEKKRVIKRTAEVFSDICDFAAERGIRIALEPLCRYDSFLINTSKDMTEFLEEVNKENIGVLLDTFHMNIEETSDSMAISEAGSRLFHFQLCENDRGIPGTGQIDWKSIALSLKKAHYKGWLSLESFTPYEKEFSTMMKSWRPLANTQDELAEKGLRFLKSTFG